MSGKQRTERKFRNSRKLHRRLCAVFSGLDGRLRRFIHILNLQRYVAPFCLTVDATADNIFISICTALLNRVPTASNSQNAITYGSYVGLSMATGFLFLSGGMRTFGTSTEDGTNTDFQRDHRNLCSHASFLQLLIS